MGSSPAPSEINFTLTTVSCQITNVAASSHEKVAWDAYWLAQMMRAIQSMSFISMLRISSAGLKEESSTVLAD